MHNQKSLFTREEYYQELTSLFWNLEQKGKKCKLTAIRIKYIHNTILYTNQTSRICIE